MILCALPHMGHYLIGHLAVLYLMPATTHLVDIKCGDQTNLLGGLAPYVVAGPVW
jgi:hypothetical protein